LPFRTVVGVGVGPKLSRGRVTARDAIVVFVGRKLSRKDVPKGELIPPTFGGFPTDVREPVLMVEPKDYERGRQPHPPEGWCRTDVYWIDWAKIHQLNVEQQREREQASSSTKRRRPRGSADD
jgi:hypothetical protein